jgi:predicted RNA-binding Zn-ribbon protein involved in translation (DUF1610 family)
MTIQVSCTACGKTLQAKDSAAGKQAKCPDCGGIISIPEAVYDAIDEPGDDFGGGFDAEFDYAAAEHQSPTAPTGSQRRPCPQCGEMIVASAAKCRFCGEIFDSRLKQQQQSRATASNADSNLSGGEWVVAIICSGIGCICGIVWMIQGKPKGLKMLGVSLAATFFWNVVNVILQMAVNPNQF